MNNGLDLWRDFSLPASIWRRSRGGQREAIPIEHRLHDGPAV